MNSKTVMALTNEMVHSQKITCIMIMHDLTHAIQYGDRFLLLKDGIFIKDYDKKAKFQLTVTPLVLKFEN